MPATVAVSLPAVDGDDGEIRRLARWLRDEDDLRGRVRLENAPIKTGEMGGVLEAVLVTVSTGTAPVLVRSQFDFLARRKEANKVSVTVESANGDKISIDCGSPTAAESLLKALDER